jgi:peroxiredoxin
MLTKRLFLGLATAAALSIGVSGQALSATGNPQVGQPAPNFTALDSNGKTVNLADFKGKVVVLEWTNHQCPYTVKHYVTGNMQKVQARSKELGVVWLTIVSSEPGTQGYVTAKEANDLTTSRNARPDHVLLDPKGVVGKAYDARVTPHMYIVDKEGTLVYMGGIDDKPTARHSSVEGAKNYVLEALDDMQAGRKIQEPVTRHYGCTIKYAS